MCSGKILLKRLVSWDRTWHKRFMRRLILLRHAKSAWPDNVWDHERPLAPRGIAAMRFMDTYLAKSKLLPDRMIVSTARRTRETYELLSPVFKPPKVELVSEPRIYEAAASTLCEVVAETPENCRTLMMVGHNPGIAELCFLLVRPSISERTDLDRIAAKFPTAAVAVLDFDQDNWEVSPRTARLERFVTPKQVGGIDED